MELKEKQILAPKVVHDDKVAILEDDAPAISSGQKGAAYFTKDRESLEFGTSQCRPATTTAEKNIERVHHMMMDDN